MAKVEINIPRPGTLMLLALAAAGWTMWFQGVGHADNAKTIVAAQVTETTASSEATHVEHGIPPLPTTTETQDQEATQEPPVKPVQLEDQARMLQQRQTTIRNRMTIFQAQFDGLKALRTAVGDKWTPEQEASLQDSVKKITQLSQMQQEGEQFLLTVLQQMWEANERAVQIAAAAAPSNPSILPPQFRWPVPAECGITARFGNDEGYVKLFGHEHTGIDIACLPGTTVVAAADGIIRAVKDNGSGFNYIITEHENGLQSLAGHLTPDFLVVEGQRVRAGDPIGYSNGTPGQPGSGTSTGPHTHFEIRKDGVLEDPLLYLPPLIGG